MSFILDDASDLLDSIVERDIVPGAAYLQGALLLVNGSNQLAECGADPASIAAVSCTDVGADTSGFNILGQKNFPPGKVQAIRVTRERRFRALYVGTLPAVDGGSYGVVKDSDGKWKVDFSDTTATRVKLVGRRTNSPENLPQVIVTVLAANVQVMA
jgi:hypothetical protein